MRDTSESSQVLGLNRYGAPCRGTLNYRLELRDLVRECRVYKLSTPERFVSSLFPHNDIEFAFFIDDVDPHVMCVAMERQIHGCSSNP